MKKTLLLALLGLCASQAAMGDWDYSADKYYLISSNKNSSMYVADVNGYAKGVAYNADTTVFWQLIPTENDGCYYIKNAVTGNYVQNTGGSQSSSNYVKTGTEPVEYYIAKNGTTVRFSSTDVDNYNDTSASPNSWNLSGNDGVSVIVWKGGTGNGGSWWNITETAYPPESGEEETGIEAGIYTFKSVKTPLYYMNCEADGTMTVCTYDVAQRIFWELIPTENENCFYIKNTANGYYIQSCAGTTAADRIMQAGTDPIEYYISLENGQVRLTSTDCDNYATTSSSPNGLNRSGSSDYVIVWAAGSSNTNSWWLITASEDLYEAQPFSPSSEVGNPAQEYYMQNAAGQYLTMDADGNLYWSDTEADGSVWYFVGESNATGGYQLVNSNGDVVYGGTGALYKVFDADNSTYCFKNAESGETLTIDGQSSLIFKTKRGDFAKSAQIYDLPCATLAKPYIQSLTLTGDAAATQLTYPVSKVSNGSVVAKSSTPSAGYTMFTESKATLWQGKDANLDITLTAALGDGQDLYAYFDWDRDGVFEVAYKLAADGTSASQVVSVPADAKLGQSRMRIRLTNNGLSGADDETVGQVLDCIVIVEAAADEFTVSLSVNDETRGTAELSSEAENTAVATPLGTAEFICWKEGKNVVSAEAEYAFTLDHNVSLTAYFSPNTEDEEETGIHEPVYGQNQLVSITAANKIISVESNANVKEIRVYSPNAQLVAKGKGSSLAVPQLSDGVYIVRVLTDSKNASAKLIIR